MKDASGGPITLVEGASFSISSSSDDIARSGAQGLFFEDTRFVSRWRVRFDGFEPCIPDGVVACSASVPSAFGSLSVENLGLAGERIEIEATGTVVKVRGLPDRYRLITAHERAPSTKT